MDVIEIAKIARYSQREAFVSRIYRAAERHACLRAPYPARRWAEIFACKEAFLKALGMGIGHGVLLRDIEVRYLQNGRMYLIPHGQARAALLEM
jgi:holo-[acyl-carrier protein] synthase